MDHLANWHGSFSKYPVHKFGTDVRMDGDLTGFGSLEINSGQMTINKK